MRRRIFTLVSTVSLLLCVGTVVLWVRSYHISDRFAYNTADWNTYRCNEYGTQVVRGIVLIDHALRIFTTREAVEMFRHDLPLNGEKLGFSHTAEEPTRLVEEHLSESNTLLASLGFSAKSFVNGPRTIGRARPVRKQVGTITIRGGSLSFPLWFPAGLFAVPVAVRLTAVLRSRFRNRSGRCPICSYDLTGNTSGTCPECGAAVDVRDNAASPPSA